MDKLSTLITEALRIIDKIEGALICILIYLATIIILFNTYIILLVTGHFAT